MYVPSWFFLVNIMVISINLNLSMPIVNILNLALNAQYVFICMKRIKYSENNLLVPFTRLISQVTIE